MPEQHPHGVDVVGGVIRAGGVAVPQRMRVQPEVLGVPAEDYLVGTYYLAADRHVLRVQRSEIL